MPQNSSGGGEMKGKFSFSWEGGLKELKNEYTSVELQHKALEWRVWKKGNSI